MKKLMTISLNYLGYSCKAFIDLLMLLCILPFIGTVKQPTWQLLKSSLRSDDWLTTMEDYQCGYVYTIKCINVKNGFVITRSELYRTISTDYQYDVNIIENLMLTLCFEYRFFKCELDHQLELEDCENKIIDTKRQKVTATFKETK